MRPFRLLAALLAASLGGLTPIALASCSSTSAPSVLGGGDGVDTGASPYDGTITTEDTGTTSADSGSADTGQLDSGSGMECGAGLTLCGLACVDLTTNGASCGSCFHGCSGMAEALICCASTCVDSTHDPNNCGACGVVCDSGSCASSMCH
jgi:Stigma-specific protein, Stig1